MKYKIYNINKIPDVLKFAAKLIISKKPTDHGGVFVEVIYF